jgi:ABC-2 type transport system permease protein
MRNVITIAQKEFKSYFSSPIGYILVGFWTLLFGYFFVTILNYFIRSSMQMTQMGPSPQSMNVNQDLLRPVLYNATILVLFILPAVTMRSYAEEKRSGTIELLLTSPLTDFQIILGKFIGAMGLYGVMLAVTLVDVVALFMYGRPEWRPIITAYIGLFLLGGCFISVGLFISSLTRNQVVAVMATFSVFLLLWIINWISNFVGPTGADIVNYLSIVDHYDDFAKGVIDTTHLVYYISFITFGLFLTAKSVDSERWRG